MATQVHGCEEGGMRGRPITVEEVFTPIFEGDQWEFLPLCPQLHSAVHRGGEEEGGVI